jgi:hypothetical protein
VPKLKVKPEKNINPLFDYILNYGARHLLHQYWILVIDISLDIL